MRRIKQSVCWWCYEDTTDLSAEDIAHAIAEAGYDGVEILEPEQWQLVKDHGLKIVGVKGHEPLENGLNKRENGDWIEGQIRERIKLAEQWDIPNLICFSGNRDGLDDETGAEVTAEHLRRVAKTAEDAGVTLILELLNSKIDHPDYQCDSTAWGIKVCAMVGSPNVKLLYDIYHMQIMEGDVIRTIQDHHAYFGHYHTAGNPGRNEIDESQELYYPAIMRAILATDFDGYVGQEFIPTGDPIAALKQGHQICDVREK
jgi:hydroxypyruvate isomerase